MWGTYVMVYVWRSEDNVVPGDQLQVIELGGKHIYLLSHHTGSPVKPLFLIVEKLKVEEL